MVAYPGAPIKPPKCRRRAFIRWCWLPSGNSPLFWGPQLMANRAAPESSRRPAWGQERPVVLGGSAGVPGWQEEQGGLIR